MNEKIRDSLDQSMSDITWKDENREYVLSKIHVSPQPVRRRRPVPIIAFALVLVLGLATALAATNENLNAVLFRYWPEAANVLMPVNLSCEDQGIRMEILSAVRRENEMLVTYSLKDLEGDRVRYIPYAHMQLTYDGVNYSTEQLRTVGIYDEDEQKMVFAAHDTYDTVIPPRDGKISAEISFLMQRESVTVDLKPYYEAGGCQFRPASAVKNALITGPYFETGLPDSQMIIDSSHSMEIPLYESVCLSGIGYTDGQLHVQIHFPDNKLIEYAPEQYFERYGAWLYVRDSQGSLLYETDLSPQALSVMRWNTESNEYDAPEWEEFFFTVDPEQLDNAEITIYVEKNLTPVEGNWKIDIPLRMIQRQ